MSICDLIELLKDCNEKLLFEVDLDLHDLAREQAHSAILVALSRLQANECDERG